MASQLEQALRSIGLTSSDDRPEHVELLTWLGLSSEGITSAKLSGSKFRRKLVVYGDQSAVERLVSEAERVLGGIETPTSTIRDGRATIIYNDYHD